MRNGFHLYDFATGATTPIADPEREILRTRLNDGKVDRQGRFVAGYMDYEEKDPLGGLYRLDPDLTVTQLDGGIIVSNGPCFSLDGGTLYFADSWTRCIFAYGYDTATGAVLSRKVFTSFARAGLRGYPDGATVDAEGFVWSAEVYGGRLVRFAPDGTIDRLVGMPVDSITSVNFGGADLDILYVTSMARPSARPAEEAAKHGRLAAACYAALGLLAALTVAAFVVGAPRGIAAAVRAIPLTRVGAVDAILIVAVAVVAIGVTAGAILAATLVAAALAATLPAALAATLVATLATLVGTPAPLAWLPASAVASDPVDTLAPVSLKEAAAPVSLAEVLKKQLMADRDNRS